MIPIGREVKLGDKDLVLAENFLVADDQEVAVTVPLGVKPMHLTIKFTSTGDPEEKASGRWETAPDGAVKFEFRGWKNALGGATDLTKFGEIADKKIYFQIAQQPAGRYNLVHLFIFVGV